MLKVVTIGVVIANKLKKYSYCSVIYRVYILFIRTDLYLYICIYMNCMLELLTIL